LLIHDRWFSPGTPASSTTKTGRHDIAEILLKVALKTPSRAIQNYGCWQLVQVRYRTREKLFFSLSSLEIKDNERRGIHLLFCDCLNGGLKSAKALERKSEVRRSRFPI
jgi:hypothetical protein